MTAWWKKHDSDTTLQQSEIVRVVRKQRCKRVEPEGQAEGGVGSELALLAHRGSHRNPPAAKQAIFIFILSSHLET